MRLTFRLCGREVVALEVSADDEPAAPARGSVTAEGHDPGEPCTLLGFAPPSAREPDDEDRARRV